MSKRTNKKVPFWVEIVMILLCGVIVSVLLYSAVRRSTSEPTTLLPTPSNGNDKWYTVTFAYQDGTVIEKKQAHEGNGVVPPIFETDGVFRGWSTPFNALHSDVETHPMVYSGNGDENLFCFNSVYVKEGDTFVVDLELKGRVSISSVDILISFDPDVMEFLGSKDADYCSVETAGTGQLVMTIKSAEPLRTPDLLTTLTFRAKVMDVYSSSISLQGSNGKYYDTSGEVPATVTTLDNKIYYLQEVG